MVAWYIVIRNMWPDPVSGAVSSALLNQPVPSMAGWLTGSARTAHTASAGAARMVLGTRRLDRHVVVTAVAAGTHRLNFVPAELVRQGVPHGT
jgi:hypothetical protein